MRKDGLDNFLFVILEECSVSKLNERELYFMNYYKSFVPDGYNINIPSGRPREIPSEVIEIIDLLLNSSIPNTEISKKTGLSVQTVNAINRGASWRQDQYTYPLRPTLFFQPSSNVYRPRAVNYCIDCNALISLKSLRCTACQSIKQRVVERPSKEELATLVAQESFVALGKKFGVSDNAVRKWCKAYDLPYRKQDIK